MPLGATAHTSVSWTVGDILTEAKLDDMVANDRAYDSHAPNGILLNNNVGVSFVDTADANREVLNLTTGDVLDLGHNTTPMRLNGVNDGWQSIGDSWAYASASTITVPSGAASYYQVGGKIKLTQTTVKYFYIVGVADTVLTVTGGTDYTVANAAISDIGYSNVENPVGFPNSFLWSGHDMRGAGSFTLSSVQTGRSRFKIVGRTLTWWVNVYATAGGSANAIIVYTVPVNISTAFALNDYLGHARYYEGATSNSAYLYRGDSASLVYCKKHTDANWATSGTTGNQFVIHYLI